MVLLVLQFIAVFAKTKKEEIEKKLEEDKQILLEQMKQEILKEELELKLTDYFDEFDYILGDWAYGKLRLKGFCNKKNKNPTEFPSDFFISPQHCCRREFSSAH